MKKSVLCEHRLFVLLENKVILVDKMVILVWVLIRWRKKLFVWEENLVMKCSVLFETDVLHEKNTTNMWKWKHNYGHTYLLRKLIMF